MTNLWQFKIILVCCIFGQKYMFTMWLFFFNEPMLLKVVTKSKFTRSQYFVQKQPNLRFCFKKSALCRTFFEILWHLPTGCQHMHWLCIWFVCTYNVWMKLRGVTNFGMLWNCVIFSHTQHSNSWIKSCYGCGVFSWMTKQYPLWIKEFGLSA